jgi:hypothetical protein
VLTGCAREDFMRTDGLTLAAGDAIATNSALQIIDPWPEGVEDTKLDPPGDRSEKIKLKEAPSAPATTGGQP